jgi:hypothetical protein
MVADKQVVAGHGGVYPPGLQDGAVDRRDRRQWSAPVDDPRQQRRPSRAQVDDDHDGEREIRRHPRRQFTQRFDTSGGCADRHHAFSRCCPALHSST